MQTITFDKPTPLSRTRFRDFSEFMRYASSLDVGNPLVPDKASRHDRARRFFAQWGGVFGNDEGSSDDPRLSFLTAKHMR